MAKGMGFKAAASSVAKREGISPKRGAAIIAAGAHKASNSAKRANQNLMNVPGVKAPPPAHDNRAGRMSSVKTDRGAFRFKANRKGD